MEDPKIDNETSCNTSEHRDRIVTFNPRFGRKRRRYRKR
jgi:hypothetical protein